MNPKAKWSAQLFLVFLCALGLKYFYSTASPDELRWILGPTTWLVELLSGRKFYFESFAGYMSSDHSFLIAASCAGVNFLITAFLVLSLRMLFRNRMQSVSWRFVPITFSFAYLATVVANTVRICIALELPRHSANISWMSANQLHRLEGIVIYFGFLVALFLLTERSASTNATSLLRRLLLPLLIYYSMALGIPLVNRAYSRGAEFWAHALFVVLIPIAVLLPLVAFDSIHRLRQLRTMPD
ncbi:MAG TPA: exosortase K [Pyrinomonadaceae bacterium]|jgi:exosortase K|nr:exosortase K [Pyrinomonadaceae bacterium]